MPRQRLGTEHGSGYHVRWLYHPEDPFCEARTPQPLAFALDLFFARLRVVGERMHTESAKRIAERRTAFLRRFLDELRAELTDG